MKIAVPASGGLVADDALRSSEFMVFSAGLFGGLSLEPSVASANGCGQGSGVAAELARAGVSLVVACNADEEFARALAARGIRLVTGASGDARAAATSFSR